MVCKYISLCIWDLYARARACVCAYLNNPKNLPWVYVLRQTPQTYLERSMVLSITCGPVGNTLQLLASPYTFWASERCRRRGLSEPGLLMGNRMHAKLAPNHLSLRRDRKWVESMKQLLLGFNSTAPQWASHQGRNCGETQTDGTGRFLSSWPTVDKWKEVSC